MTQARRWLLSLFAGAALLGGCGLRLPFPPGERFDDYELVAAWGDSGGGPGQMSRPQSIALDGSGRVYVSDRLNHRVTVFSERGAYLGHFGAEGGDDGQLLYPRHIAIDVAGFLYVVDAGNQRIQKFALDGTYLDQWGTEGEGDAQFRQPIGIAVDRGGHVYVTDERNQNVQRFKGDGTFLLRWSTGAYVAQGRGSAPQGVAIGPAGDVWVTDGFELHGGNSRLLKFTASGAAAGAWGRFGSQAGQFMEPEGVALDANGNVYVADAFNERVQILRSSGTYVTEIPIPPFKRGWGSVVTGVATDSRGRVFVVSPTLQRVMVFAPSPHWSFTRKP